MPTGYTADLPATFSEFALRCARAFGATVTVREQPLSAGTPEVIRPAEYQLTSMRQALAGLDAVRLIPKREHAKRARLAYEQAAARYQQTLAEAAVLRQKYERMLVDINAWTPPTKDHEELKAFMLRQVDESMRHDCDMSYLPEPKRLTGKAWHAEEIEEAERRLEWSARTYAEGVERARKSTQWLQQLRGSL